MRGIEFGQARFGLDQDLRFGRTSDHEVLHSEAAFVADDLDPLAERMTEGAVETCESGTVGAGELEFARRVDRDASAHLMVTGTHPTGHFLHHHQSHADVVPTEVADASKGFGLHRGADVALEERVVGLEGEGGFHQRGHQSEVGDPLSDQIESAVVHEHHAVHELDSGV